MDNNTCLGVIHLELYRDRTLVEMPERTEEQTDALKQLIGLLNEDRAQAILEKLKGANG